MEWLKGILRLIIPFAVLYTIGYYVPGFSALTVAWLGLLSILIWAADWLVRRFVMDRTGRIGNGIVLFLVATVVIFTVTLVIEGGGVPFGGALLAAVIIAVLTYLLVPGDVKAVRHDGSDIR